MYNKIMVPLDGSPLAECVLSELEKVAGRGSSCQIVLFEALEPPVILADFPASLGETWRHHIREETAHIEQKGTAYLRGVAERLQGAGYNVVTKTTIGKPAEQIVDYAVQNGVDLILMATHGRSGVSRWAYGSVADKVLHASPVPVMLVRPNECKQG